MGNIYDDSYMAQSGGLAPKASRSYLNGLRANQGPMGMTPYSQAGMGLGPGFNPTQTPPPGGWPSMGDMNQILGIPTRGPGVDQGSGTGPGVYHTMGSGTNPSLLGGDVSTSSITPGMPSPVTQPGRTNAIPNLNMSGSGYTPTDLGGGGFGNMMKQLMKRYYGGQ